MPIDSEEEAVLFFEALNQKPALRGAFLSRECGGKPGLRVRVERLLAAHAEAESFFAEAELAIVSHLNTQTQ